MEVTSSIRNVGIPFFPTFERNFFFLIVVFVLVYSLAQVSKAAIPEDAGGPFGQRLGISLSGPQSSALLVTAFVTPRASPSHPARYSLVVLNCELF